MSNMVGNLETKIVLNGGLFPMGTKGYSAYEVAVQQGFKGTVDEWLASLVGPPGQDGSIKFEELTPEQKEMLRGPKGEPFLYSDFTQEQLEALRGPQGIQGETGPQGEQGPAGAPGADGKSATIKIGSVTTLAAGSQATVTNVGTENEAIFNFGIPKGEPGSGGGTAGGTTDYVDLSNKPKINNVELNGNKTLSELGIQHKGNYLTSVPSVYKTKAENDALYQPKGDYLTSIPSEYITETELNGKGFLTNVPSTYKTKAENDALYQPKGNYLTSFTETDPVFSASASASITNADISNWNAKSNFSGSYNDLTDKPTIPTTTQILDKIYPVGSIYISANSTNPSVLFGGTWEQIEDRFLLGAGDTYEAGSTGGEAKHTLTEEEMPKHRHPITYDDSSATFYTSWGETTEHTSLIQTNGSNQWQQPYADWVGGSQPHNNMPPYLTVYMWQRIR